MRNIYSYTLRVYPKGNEAEIKKFREVVASKKEDLWYVMGGDPKEFNVEDLQFEAVEDPASDPQDLLREVFEEFPKLSFFLAVRAYISKYEVECAAYYIFKKGEITEQREWEFEWSEYENDGDSNSWDGAVDYCERVYKSEVESRVSKWLTQKN
jgi:hypothetical protein